MAYVIPVSIIFTAVPNPQIIEMSEALFVQELDVLEIRHRADAQSPVETMVLLMSAVMDPYDSRRVRTGYAVNHSTSAGRHLAAIHADTILIANFFRQQDYSLAAHGDALLRRAYEMESDLHTMVQEQAQLIRSLGNLPSQLLEDLKRNQKALVNAHAQQDQNITEIRDKLRKQFQVYPIP